MLHALSLEETLEEERQALEAQDSEALDVAVASKSKCVADLGGVDEKRKKLCIAAGFPDEAEQMQKLIAWCDEHSIVANSWQKLLDTVSRCDATNMTNGAIIRSRKQHIDSSISIIRGEQPNTSIYNRSGQEPQRNSLRSIAEA